MQTTCSCTWLSHGHIGVRRLIPFLHSSFKRELVHFLCTDHLHVLSAWKSSAQNGPVCAVCGARLNLKLPGCCFKNKRTLALLDGLVAWRQWCLCLRVCARFCSLHDFIVCTKFVALNTHTHIHVGLHRSECDGGRTLIILVYLIIHEYMSNLRLNFSHWEIYFCGMVRNLKFMLPIHT